MGTRQSRTYQYGYIDTTGKEVVPVRCTDAKLLTGGLFRVTDGSQQSLLDLRGNPVWQEPAVAPAIPALRKSNILYHSSANRSPGANVVLLGVCDSEAEAIRWARAFPGTEAIISVAGKFAVYRTNVNYFERRRAQTGLASDLPEVKLVEPDLAAQKAMVKLLDPVKACEASDRAIAEAVKLFDNTGVLDYAAAQDIEFRPPQIWTYKTGDKAATTLSVESITSLPAPSTSPGPEQLRPFRRNGSCGYMDCTGRVVIEAKYADAERFHEGLARVIEKNEKGMSTCSFIDTNGKRTTAEGWLQATIYKDGLATVQDAKGWGIIDKTGSYVVPPNPEMQSVASFSEGLAAASKGGKIGFIDENGQWAIEPIYGAAQGFRGGISPVSLANRWGVIDKSGKLVVPLQFAYIQLFAEGLAGATSDGKLWGFIDATGKWVIQPQYQGVWQFSEGLAGVYLSGKTFYIDRTGQQAFPETYDNVSEFNNGVAAVGIIPYRIIDKTGKVLWEMEHH